jgi:hypothetical protein
MYDFGIECKGLAFYDGNVFLEGINGYS